MGGVAAVWDDITGKNSRDAAINAQRDGANAAINLQREMYQQGREDMQPWRQAGQDALGQMNDQRFNQQFDMNSFQKDPGYQFRMDEGMKALQASAAARGGLASGRTLKDLTRFGQDVASQEYGNAYNRFYDQQDRSYNRLAGLAGVGQTTSGQLMQSGQNMANQVGQAHMGMGNAQAAAHMNQYNTLANLGGQAIGGAVAFSDERLKSEIEEITPDDLVELKSSLKARMFRYRSPEHGQGQWAGVMAQDLERSKLGRTLVVEDEQGQKQIDITKAVSLLLATLAEG